MFILQKVCGILLSKETDSQTSQVFTMTNFNKHKLNIKENAKLEGAVVTKFSKRWKLISWFIIGQQLVVFMLQMIWIEELVVGSLDDILHQGIWLCTIL